MHCLIFSTLRKQRPKTAIETCYQKGTSVKILLVLKICFLIVALKINNWIGLHLSNQNAEMSSERRKILRKSIFKGKSLQNLCQQNAGSATYYILHLFVDQLLRYCWFMDLAIWLAKDIFDQTYTKVMKSTFSLHEINHYTRKLGYFIKGFFEYFKKNYIHN